MVLIDLKAYRRQDIGVVLDHLQELHRKGEVKGLALVVMDKVGREDVSFTGAYKADTKAAQVAALQILRRARENDERKSCVYY